MFNRSVRISSLFAIPLLFLGVGIVNPTNSAYAVSLEDEVFAADVETYSNYFGNIIVDETSAAAKMMNLKNTDERRIFLQSLNRQLLTTSEGTTSEFVVPEMQVVKLEPEQDDPTTAKSTEGIEKFDYPDSRFDINGAIALAYSEVGTSRPTGWSAEGECIMSTKRWINVGGGGNWHGGGTPLDNYVGSDEVSMSDARPGDIVQYIYSSSPTSWVSGIHTVMITGVNKDGTFKIVESNNPGGSGLVTSNDSWVPIPPEGFEARFFRF